MSFAMSLYYCYMNVKHLQDIKHKSVYDRYRGIRIQSIGSIPAEQMRPNVIIYEHKHLDSHETSAAMHYLRRHCYITYIDGENTFALAGLKVFLPNIHTPA